MSRTALVAALLIGLGTVALRASVLVIAERLGDVPPRAREVLRMIPPAALAALIAPALLRPRGALELVSPESVAGLLALLVAWRTRNALATIVVGLVAVVLLELVF